MFVYNVRTGNDLDEENGENLNAVDGKNGGK
jgi:hypothetical protein